MPIQIFLSSKYRSLRSIAGILGVVLTLFTATIHADAFSNGLDEYKKGNFQEAAKYWLTASEKGNRLAQHNLAVLYSLGQGVDRHLGIAAHWYRTAAEGRYDPSSLALGQLYYEGGPDFPRNPDEAVYWWLKAAERGDVLSQTLLAKVLIEGEDVPRDILGAKKWLKQAAQKHHQEAIELLAEIDAEIATVTAFDDAWVKRQNPNAYTIEYYRGAEKVSAREFVIFGEIENAAIYQSRYDDFIVVSGVYSNPERALEAIGRLSDKIRQYRPKPRIFSAIQAELRTEKKQLTKSPNQTQRAAKVTQQPPAPATMKSETVLPAPASSRKVMTVLPSQWILERDPNKYTIQLIRGKTLSNAMEFVNQQEIANAVIYDAPNGDSVVVAGVFNNRERAQITIGKLPKGVTAHGAFPQKFSKIQNIMRSMTSRSSPVEKVIATPSANTANKGSITESVGGIPSDAWILAQDSNKYTMQMIRVPSLAKAQQFVKRHNLKQPAIYRTAVNNYDVIDGVYSTMGQVRAQISILPEVLKVNGPFPRQFKKVKIALNPPTNPNSVIESPLALSRPQAPTIKKPASRAAIEDWAKARSPGEYTLLLFASEDLNQADRFLIEYNIQNGLVHRLPDGRFAAIAGIYADSAAAQRAVVNLPQKLRFFSPVGVSFGELRGKTPGQQEQATELKVTPLNAGLEISFDEFWAGQDPDQSVYTLLLYNSTTKDDAKLFIERFQILNSAVFERKDKTFGVIAGKFSEADKAQSAIRALPNELKTYAPYPLSYQEILESLGASGGLNQPATLNVKWLMERDPQTFTVRLFRGGSRSEAEKFIKDYALSNAAIYGQVSGDFNVISGVFAENSLAQDAINGLPDAFADLDIVIELFGELQEEAGLFAELEKASNLTYGQDSVWIRNQPEQFHTYYTIEIGSAVTPNELIDLARRNQQSSALIYQTKKDDYSMILGMFESKKQAKTWEKTFSDEQRKEYKPKFRKISKVIKNLSDTDQKINL